MTKVKICGVTQVEHALAAAEAGADYVGLNFAPSSRQITVELAGRIIATLRQLKQGNTPEPVAVFANAPWEEMRHTANALGLRTVQLSGTEELDEIEDFPFTVIKAVHIEAGLPEPVAVASAGRTLARLAARTVIPLLDTKVAGRFGGTGQTFSQSIARNLAQSYDFFLAGGLTPDNVAQAVAAVHPWGVDVSSGVESDGVKDVVKIRRFVVAARSVAV